MTKLWTANSRTYRERPDGPYLTIFYQQAVNAKGPEGAWKPIEGTTISGEPATANPGSAPHIDASTTLSATQDCSLISNKPTESSCTATSDKVGWDGVDTDNTLIQFNVKEALPPDANVLNAQLGMYLSSSSTSKAVSVSAYALLKPWTTSATWNTYDGTHAWAEAGAEKAGSDYSITSTVLNPSVVAPAGWAHWYPTQIVQEWANGTLENHGLELADTTQRTTNDALTFSSSRASSNKPYLTISWTPRGQEDPTAYTMQTFPVNESSTMKVNLASGDLFVNSNDLSVTPKAGPPLLVEHNYDSRNEEGGTVNPFYSLPGASVYADGSVAIGINRYDYEPFIRQSNGTFLTPRGIHATLCEINETTCNRNSVDVPNKGKYALTFNENGTGPFYREGYKMDFGENGGVWSIADPEGHAIAWNYESKLKLKDGEGHAFTRNTTEAGGSEVTSSWTESGGSGREVKYAYNSGGKLETYTDPEGHKTKYAYESGTGLLKEITPPSGSTIKLSYTSHRRIEKIEGAESNGATGAWEYKYYEAGKAPEPCNASQKALVATSPEEGAIYCSNAFDEVEKVQAVKPPVFHEFEVSAFDESTTSPTMLFFTEAEDPPLPDGSPGPGVAVYWYRYSVNGGSFSSWASTGVGEVEVPHIVPGATVAIEVYAKDPVGNTSATVTASTVVPPIPEGNWLGEESTEKDKSLEEEFSEQAEGTEMTDAEEDTSPPPPPRLPGAIIEKRSEITQVTGVRDAYQAFVIGTAVPKMTFDVKLQVNHEYYGRFYKYVGTCGWVFTGTTKQTSTKIVGTCPAYHAIDPVHFAKLINCNFCNHTWQQELVPLTESGKPVNTNIPVYANVRPYAAKDEPHEKFTTLPTVVNGVVQKVGWRYITRSGNYALVSVTYPRGSKYKRWAFIEAKWLPSTTTLCKGKEPETASSRSGWPKVCSQT